MLFADFLVPFWKLDSHNRATQIVKNRLCFKIRNL